MTRGELQVWGDRSSCAGAQVVLMMDGFHGGAYPMRFEPMLHRQWDDEETKSSLDNMMP